VRERARLERATAGLVPSRASTWFSCGVCWRRVSRHCDTDLILICALGASLVELLADGRMRLRAEADEVQRVVGCPDSTEPLDAHGKLCSHGFAASLLVRPFAMGFRSGPSTGSRAGWATGAGKIESPWAGCTGTVGRRAREPVLRCCPSPPSFLPAARCEPHQSENSTRGRPGDDAHRGHDEGVLKQVCYSLHAIGADVSLTAGPSADASFSALKGRSS